MAGQTWATEDLGLPTSRVDLPVRAQGWLLGHFVLTPTRGRTVDAQRLLTAVAVADLVGAVLLADDSDVAPNEAGLPAPVEPRRRSPRSPGVTDVLFIGAFVAFFAVMLGFVFLYDRSVASAEYDAPDETRRPTTGMSARSIPA